MVSVTRYPEDDNDASEGDDLRTVFNPRTSVTRGSRPLTERSASRKNSQSKSIPSKLCRVTKSLILLANIAFDLPEDEVAFDSNVNVLSAGRMLTRTFKLGFRCLREARNFKSPVAISIDKLN